MTLRSMIVLLTCCGCASLGPSAEADQPCAPIWVFHDSSGGTRYAIAIDTDARQQSGALLWVHDAANAISRVDDVGIQSPAGTFPIPPYPPGVASTFGVASRDGAMAVVFGATSMPADAGWDLPIPDATLRRHDGRTLASYETLLDSGYLAEDGSTLVSFASRRSGLVEDAPEELEKAALFFDALGDRVGLVQDPNGLYWTGSLASDGTLFAHGRTGGEVAAHSALGTYLWSHAAPGELLHRIDVSPGGTYVVVQSQLIDSPCTGIPIRVLSGNGQLLYQLNETRQAKIHFND